MKLIPHCLTPNEHLKAFVVWLGLVSLRPLSHPETYLLKTTIEAVPKYISGRTSYLRVRLAFHLYPQLIPAFCNIHGFGPSLRFYLGFNLAMGSSLGFGSNPSNTFVIMKTRPSTSNNKIASYFASETINKIKIFGRQVCFRQINALFRLAFATAPKRMFLNLAA